MAAIEFVAVLVVVACNCAHAVHTVPGCSGGGCSVGEHSFVLASRDRCMRWAVCSCGMTSAFACGHRQALR